MAVGVSLKQPRNFSELERSILVEIIKNHPIVDDKGYDSKTLAKKKNAWEEIYQEFSSSLPGFSGRTIAQIKGCWKRIKIEAKKAQQTDGVPPPQLDNSSTEVVLSLLGDVLEQSHNSDDSPSPLNGESCGLLSGHSVENLEMNGDEASDSSRAKKKKKRLTTLKESLLDLVKQSAVVEKQKQLAEKRREEAETLRKEVYRLKKWKLIQECTRQKFGLPPDDFR